MADETRVVFEDGFYSVVVGFRVVGRYKDAQIMGVHLAMLHQEVERRGERIAELEDLFDLQQTRMGKATDMWRAANPGNELMSPDLGRLLEWLMKEAGVDHAMYIALMETEMDWWIDNATDEQVTATIDRHGLREGVDDNWEKIKAMLRERRSDT